MVVGERDRTLSHILPVADDMSILNTLGVFSFLVLADDAALLQINKQVGEIRKSWLFY